MAIPTYYHTRQLGLVGGIWRDVSGRRREAWGRGSKSARSVWSRSSTYDRMKPKWDGIPLATRTYCERVGCMAGDSLHNTLDSAFWPVRCRMIERGLGVE